MILRRMLHRCRRSISRPTPSALSLLLIALPAFAGAAEVSVLMDQDDDPATGCSVMTVDGPFDGVEVVLVTTVDDGSDEVTAVVTQDCVGGVLGAPVPVMGLPLPWPVGIANGTMGADVVETALPLTAPLIGATVRLGFTSDNQFGSMDALLTTDGSQGGNDILLIGLPQPVIEIPTITPLGLILLALVLGAGALLVLRRGSVSGSSSAAFLVLLVCGSGVLWALGDIILDGDPAEWAAVVDASGHDVIGDAVGADIAAGFATLSLDGLTVAFRVDLFRDTPPTAVDDAATVTEDDPATTVDVLANDIDIDGGPMMIILADDPAGGTVVITNGGADLTYQPDPETCNDGAPTDDFTYTLNGGSVATVSMTVTCVDDPPIAVDDVATVTEDDPATTIDVLANDTDIDGGPMLVQSTSDPAGGTVVITNGGADLTYAPDADFCNDGTPTDDFTYTLNGGSTATVAVTVTCEDDPPTAVDDAATVTEDDPATTIDVLANDTDPDAGTMTIQSTSDPAGGTVVITNGGDDLTYQPDPDFCNDGVPTDDFTYTLNGGSVGTVAMTVNCVNDPPIKNPGGGGPAAFVEGGGPVAIDPGVTVIDVDDTNLESATVTLLNLLDAGQEVLSAATGGTSIVASYVAPTLTLTGTDTVANYVAVLQSVAYDNSSIDPDETNRILSCLVNDGDSNSNTVMTTVTVTAINSPPIAGSDSYDTVGNTELVVGTGGPAALSLATVAVAGASVLDNDSDPEATPLTVISATGVATDSTGPTFDVTTTNGGTVSMDSAGRFTYLPPRGVVNLVDSFTYAVQDAGGASTSGTVNVNIINSRIWFVHNDPAGEPLNPVDGPNFGRSDDPFDLLAAVGAAQAAGDLICVYQGDGTSTGMNTGLTLTADNVLLHGEHQGCEINQSLNGLPAPEVLLAPAANSHPVISHAAGTAITVDATGASVTGIAIRGVELSAVGGNALDVTSAGANNVGLQFENSRVAGASSEGIDINHGSSGLATVTIDNLSLYTSTGNALDARTTGSGDLHIAFTNNLDVTSVAGSAIVIDGSGGAGVPVVVAFDGNSVNPATNGIGLSAIATVFDATPGGNFDPVAAGSFSVGDVAGPSRVGGLGVQLGAPGNPVSGSLSFSDLDVASTGAGLMAIGSGLAMPASGFQLDTTTGTIDASSGPALDLGPLTAGITLATATSSNSPTSGIALTDVEGTVNAGPGSSITGAVGDSFLLDGGTVTVNYQGDISHTNGSAAVRVQGGHSAGTVVFSIGTLNATNGTGLQFDNADGGYQFNGTTTLNGGDAGVDIENGSSGNLDFVGSTSITHAAAGPAFRINNSSAVVDYNGTIVDTNGLAVDIISLTAGGSAGFDGPLAASGAGIRLNTVSGTVDFANADLTNTATVDIDSNNAAVTFADLSLDQTAGAVNAFDVNGGTGNVTTTLTGSGLRSSTPNRLVNITGRAGGSVSFDGPATVQGTVGNTGINVSGGAAANSVIFDAAVDLGTGPGNRTTGGGVNMSGNAANSLVRFNSLDIFTSNVPGIVATGSGEFDTATLAGAVNIDTTGNGARSLDLDGIVANAIVDSVVCNNNSNCVELTSLAPTSVTTLAGLDLTCSSGTCFNAGAARTVEVTGGGNAIAATNAVGLNLTDTTIGGNEVTFESIAASGAANGIILNNTGTSGGLVVTGDGMTATQGGNGSGGTIQNTTGIAIDVDSSSDLRLQNLTVDTPASHGIDLSEVVGTSRFDNITVDNVDVAGAHGIRLQNFASSDLDFTIDNSRFMESDTGAVMVLAQFRGAIGTTRIDVEDSRFDELDPSAFQLNGYEGSGTQTSGTLTHNFLRNTIEESDLDGVGETNHACGGSLTCAFIIDGNTYRNLAKAGNFNSGLLNAGYGGGAITPGTTMTLDITDNSLSQTDSNSSGNRRGINIINEHSGGTISSMDVLVDNNTADDIGDREALYISNRSTVTTLDITITRNRFGTGTIGGTTANNVGGTRDGVFIENRAGTTNLLVGGSLANANTIQTDNSSSDAIMEIEADDPNTTVNATVTHNTFSSTGNSPVQFDLVTDADSICLDLRDNTATNTGTEWLLDENGGTFTVEGAGTGTVTAGQLQAAPHNNSGDFSFPGGAVTNNNNTNCTMPSP